MTTWNIFIAVAGALVTRDIVARIIGEISYYLHRKKHGSLVDYFESLETAEEK